MAQKRTESKKTAARKSNLPEVTEKVGNYEKHPFFVKKANAAKALLNKVGLPQPLVKKGS